MKSSPAQADPLFQQRHRGLGALGQEQVENRDKKEVVRVRAAPKVLAYSKLLGPELVLAVELEIQLRYRRGEGRQLPALCLADVSCSLRSHQPLTRDIGRLARWGSCRSAGAVGGEASASTNS